MSCSYELCQNQPRFICKCKPNVHYCANHSSIHCSLKGEHELKSLFTHLDDSTFSSFIQRQLSTHSAISSIIQYINHKSASLIQQIVKLRDQSTLQLSQNLESIHLSIKSAHKTHEILTQDYINYLETEDYDLNIDYPEPGRLESEIFDFFTQDFTLNLKLVPNQKSDLVKSFVFFEKNSKNLNIFDLVDMKTNIIQVNSQDVFGDYAGWCRLPGRKVFHFGGQLTAFYPPVSSTYLIDVDSGQIEQKQDGLNKKYTVGVCAFISPHVYVFGGSGLLSSLYSESEKFDIEKNEWSSISMLPFGSDYNSCIIKNSEIFVSGYRLGVFVYSPQLDSYSNSLELDSGNKILLIEGNTVFLLYGSKIYTQEEENWIRSSSLTILSEETVLKSYPVKRGTSFYFILSDNFVYKFNLVTGAVDRVKALQCNEGFW